MATLANGIARRPSRYSVDETVTRIEALLHDKGIKLFALVDHSGEAKQAGLQMPPTKVLIFGAPKAGTPVMLATPSAAIDLPLKLLVAEDADGTVWITYNTPAYLQQRHGFPADLIGNLVAIEAFASQAGQ